MLKIYLFLCISIVTGSEAGPVEFIKPCVRNDKKCLLESSNAAIPYFANGIPEIGIPPADPIIINSINADIGDLKLDFTDLKVSGMGKSVFINVERPNPDKTLLLKFEFPVVVTGKYKVGGKLLFLDVVGEGETEIKCDKLRVNMDMSLEKIEKDGKQYYNVSGYTYTYELVEKVTYSFTNLYYGDEKKALALLDVINQNWKEIFFVNGKPVVDKVIAEEVSRIKKFFLSNTIDEVEKPAN